MDRKTNLQNLRLEIFAYDYSQPYSFSGLLSRANEIFPILDQELASVYSINRDTIALWKSADIIPSNRIQSDIIGYIRSRIESESLALEDSNAMTIYSPKKPVAYIPESIPFYIPLALRLKNWLNELGRLWNSGNISPENFSALVKRTEKDREALFQVKLNGKIKKCNRLILKAIKGNETSVLFRVGKKTVESVRLANAIKDYLMRTDMCTVEVSYDYINIDDGAVFLEIYIK